MRPRSCTKNANEAESTEAISPEESINAWLFPLNKDVGYVQTRKNAVDGKIWSPNFECKCGKFDIRHTRHVANWNAKPAQIPRHSSMRHSWDLQRLNTLWQGTNLSLLLNKMRALFTCFRPKMRTEDASYGEGCKVWRRMRREREPFMSSRQARPGRTVSQLQLDKLLHRTTSVAAYPAATAVLQVTDWHCGRHNPSDTNRSHSSVWACIHNSHLRIRLVPPRADRPHPVYPSDYSLPRIDTISVSLDPL